MSTPKLSRRTWLKGLALFYAAIGMPSLLVSTAAEAKASKASVHALPAREVAAPGQGLPPRRRDVF